MWRPRPGRGWKFENVRAYSPSDTKPKTPRSYSWEKEDTPLTVSKSNKPEPTISIADLGMTMEEVSEQTLDMVAREGARMILEAALNEEVDAFLNRGWYERRAESRRGYRNGTRRRKLQCGSGEVEVRKPKIVGAEEPFESRIIDRWQRRSEQLESVLPALYVEGLSTRDFKRALGPLLGESGLSRSSISRLNQALKASFAAWRKRDLSKEKIVYLFLDGFYLGVRKGGREKDALLIAHAVCEDGSRVLLGVYLGGRESTESWKITLRDLVDRGMIEPKLIITDGNPGLCRAMKEVFPGGARQRCTAHKTRNVLSRVKKSRQAEVKRMLNNIFHGACLEDALKAASDFHRRYGKEFPTATEVLAKDLADCLTFYRFPESHWRRIRTSNVLERAFLEVRRRTDVIKRLPDEMSALALVFGVLEEDRMRWHGFTMGTEIRKAIVLAFKRMQDEPIRVDWAEKFAA
jgi:putative transposase